MEQASNETVRCFCPKCHEEQFDVIPTESGKYGTEWGTAYWFGGNGKCASCGYEDYYSDSSI